MHQNYIDGRQSALSPQCGQRPPDELGMRRVRQQPRTLNVLA